MEWGKIRSWFLKGLLIAIVANEIRGLIFAASSFFAAYKVGMDQHPVIFWSTVAAWLVLTVLIPTFFLRRYAKRFGIRPLLGNSLRAAACWWKRTPVL